MKVFGFSYEGYVFDTQILFPKVFLNNVPNLSQTNRLYNDCVDELLDLKVHWIVLPSNEDEFNLLIVDKFRKLLQDIGTSALKCKNKGKRAFYRETSDLLRYQRYPTDFLVYWRSNKEDFSKWFNLDRTAIRKQEMRLVREALERYQELISNAEIVIKEWEEPEHEKKSCEFCEELKHLRDIEKAIPCESHDEDFEIISDCLVYCNHYLQYGILYLITNDDACYQTIKTITCFKNKQGKILHVQGFDCKKPVEVLNQLKRLTQKGQIT